MTAFSVAEKRIVSYNPALAKKQKAEILKMAVNEKVKAVTGIEN